jgi:hypothetical protein
MFKLLTHTVSCNVAPKIARSATAIVSQALSCLVIAASVLPASAADVVHHDVTVIASVQWDALDCRGVPYDLGDYVEFTVDGGIRSLSVGTIRNPDDREFCFVVPNAQIQNRSGHYFLILGAQAYHNDGSTGQYLGYACEVFWEPSNGHWWTRKKVH